MPEYYSLLVPDYLLGIGVGKWCFVSHSNRYSPDSLFSYPILIPQIKFIVSDNKKESLGNSLVWLGF